VSAPGGRPSRTELEGLQVNENESYRTLNDGCEGDSEEWLK
jgi:hypothetical protein